MIERKRRKRRIDTRIESEEFVTLARVIKSEHAFVVVVRK